MTGLISTRSGCGSLPFDQHILRKSGGHLRPVFHHDDALRYADLRRRKADARRLVHRGDHPLNEVLDLRRAYRAGVNRRRDGPENRVADLNNPGRFDFHS